MCRQMTFVIRLLYLLTITKQFTAKVSCIPLADITTRPKFWPSWTALNGNADYRLRIQDIAIPVDVNA